MTPEREELARLPVARLPPGEALESLVHADARERNQRLARVTAAIADAVEPEEVFCALVDLVTEALGASSAGLWLVSNDQRATLVRSRGYNPAALASLKSLPLDGEMRVPVLDAIVSKTAIWLQSQATLLSTYPHLASWVSTSREYRIWCLPLLSDGRAIGALALTFDDAPPIDDEARALSTALARHSAHALERLRLLEAERTSADENRRLHEEGRVARERAEMLFAMADTVIRSDRIEQVFEAALDTIERALLARRAAVLAFDHDGVMRFKAQRGLSEAYRAAVEGHSPWSHDVRDPQPIFVSDVEQDPAMATFLPLFQREGIAALGFIPLFAGGRLLGKFMVYYDQPKQCSPLEIELGQAIANHVAATLMRFATLAELKENLKLSEMFMGILGHDLRNPLGAIVYGTELLLLENENGRLAKPIARIRSSADRMTRMIDQLLDFTRVRVGSGLPLHPTRLDLLPLLRQVLDELDDANPDWKLKLVDRGGDLSGDWDGDRLSQVFSNLVANAIKHGSSPERGVTVCVDGREDALLVTVHNHGVIAAEVLPNVFAPMAASMRGRNVRSTGLGLGLYITREIVRGHGGTIEVHSTAAGGTTFSVRLPRSR